MFTIYFCEHCQNIFQRSVLVIPFQDFYFKISRHIDDENQNEMLQSSTEASNSIMDAIRSFTEETKVLRRTYNTAILHLVMIVMVIGSLRGCATDLEEFNSLAMFTSARDRNEHKNEIYFVRAATDYRLQPNSVYYFQACQLPNLRKKKLRVQI